MDISDEDADEMLLALSHEGFGLPFMARIAEHGREGIAAADEKAWEDNRRALRNAIQETTALGRYRIY
jgi:2-oxo-4-hydroxy-4-carboxy--5-ureidoimidazoline (OHCU) decarboxylase